MAPAGANHRDPDRTQYSPANCSARTRTSHNYGCCFSFRTLKVSRGGNPAHSPRRFPMTSRHQGKAFQRESSGVVEDAGCWFGGHASHPLTRCVFVADFIRRHHYLKKFCSSSLNLLSAWCTYLSAFAHIVLK